MTAKTAFIFPGQGSQSVGMLADLMSESVVQETFAEASEVLGYDLAALVSEGPVEKLNQTEITQPAILTASIALWRLWLSKGGVKPDYLAGHSLGEYSAMVASGVLPFAAAVKLVEKRGQLMQSAVPAGEGAMAAIIGLEDDKVVEACAASTTASLVAPVNYNAPGQVVIAGHKAAVEQAMVQAKELGAKRALPLPVSAPSHCALMKPAADALMVEFATVEFGAVSIPVVQNVNAEIAADLDTIKANLIAQLYQPVQWVASVQQLSALGVTSAVECGPGKVLSGLVKRIERSIEVANIDTAASFSAAVAKEEA